MVKLTCISACVLINLLLIEYCAAKSVKNESPIKSTSFINTNEIIHHLVKRQSGDIAQARSSQAHSSSHSSPYSSGRVYLRRDAPRTSGSRHRHAASQSSATRTDSSSSSHSLSDTPKIRYSSLRDPASTPAPTRSPTTPSSSSHRNLYTGSRNGGGYYYGGTTSSSAVYPSRSSSTYGSNSNSNSYYGSNGQGRNYNQQYQGYGGSSRQGYSGSSQQGYGGSSRQGYGGSSQQGYTGSNQQGYGSRYPQSYGSLSNQNLYSSTSNNYRLSSGYNGNSYSNPRGYHSPYQNPYGNSYGSTTNTGSNQGSDYASRYSGQNLAVSAGSSNGVIGGSTASVSYPNEERGDSISYTGSDIRIGSSSTRYDPSKLTSSGGSVTSEVVYSGQPARYPYTSSQNYEYGQYPNQYNTGPSSSSEPAYGGQRYPSYYGSTAGSTGANQYGYRSQSNGRSNNYYGSSSSYNPSHSSNQQYSPYTNRASSSVSQYAGTYNNRPSSSSTAYGSERASSGSRYGYSNSPSGMQYGASASSSIYPYSSVSPMSGGSSQSIYGSSSSSLGSNSDYSSRGSNPMSASNSGPLYGGSSSSIGQYASSSNRGTSESQALYPESSYQSSNLPSESYGGAYTGNGDASNPSYGNSQTSQSSNYATYGNGGRNSESSLGRNGAQSASNQEDSASPSFGGSSESYDSSYNNMGVASQSAYVSSDESSRYVHGSTSVPSGSSYSSLSNSGSSVSNPSSSYYQNSRIISSSLGSSGRNSATSSLSNRPSGSRYSGSSVHSESPYSNSQIYGESTSGSSTSSLGPSYRGSSISSGSSSVGGSVSSSEQRYNPSSPVLSSQLYGGSSGIAGATYNSINPSSESGSSSNGQIYASPNDRSNSYQGVGNSADPASSYSGSYSQSYVSNSIGASSSPYLSTNPPAQSHQVGYSGTAESSNRDSNVVSNVHGGGLQLPSSSSFGNTIINRRLHGDNSGNIPISGSNSDSSLGASQQVISSESRHGETSNGQVYDESGGITVGNIQASGRVSSQENEQDSYRAYRVNENTETGVQTSLGISYTQNSVGSSTNDNGQRTSLSIINRIYAGVPRNTNSSVLSSENVAEDANEQDAPVLASGTSYNVQQGSQHSESEVPSYSDRGSPYDSPVSAENSYSSLPAQNSVFARVSHHNSSRLTVSQSVHSNAGQGNIGNGYSGYTNHYQGGQLQYIGRDPSRRPNYSSSRNPSSTARSRVAYRIPSRSRGRQNSRTSYSSSRDSGRTTLISRGDNYPNTEVSSSSDAGNSIYQSVGYDDNDSDEYPDDYDEETETTRQTIVASSTEQPISNRSLGTASRQSSLINNLRQHAQSNRGPLPDLVIDKRKLIRNFFLDRKPLSSLLCAYNERCLSSSADLSRPQSVRKLLRFQTTIRNVGNAPFRPATPKSQWLWHQCHNHSHSMNVFTHYDLLDRNMKKVAEGHKASFCLEDTSCRGNISKFYDCEKGEQGISPGCEDTYKASIDCQWIDVTGIYQDEYYFRILVNPEGLIPESHYSNNGLLCQVSLRRVTVQIFNCKAIGLNL